jgi:hypothetical protein
MILADIRSYLAGRRRVSLSDIAIHFGIDEQAMRGMLTTFERKGQVRRIGGTACGSCCGCATSAVESYEWIGPAARATQAPDGAPAERPGRHA